MTRWRHHTERSLHHTSDRLRCTLPLEKALKGVAILSRHKCVHAMQQMAPLVAEKVHQARLKLRVGHLFLAVEADEGGKGLKVARVKGRGERLHKLAYSQRGVLKWDFKVKAARITVRGNVKKEWRVIAI